MNVLSLFDGISCGHLALDRAGIPVNRYYAAEIDKWAIKCTQHNYPDTIQLGDVTQWHSWDVPWEDIDLILAGSPCQGFSFSGKQLAFEDPRSKLFFTFADILKHTQSVNPEVKFLLENVRMKKQSEQVITDALGVDPVTINSSLVSAQNRQRLYWTNISADLPQPEDKQVVLSDILEDGYTDREKSYCIDACYYKGGDLNQYFNKSRRQLVFESETVYQKLAPYHRRHYEKIVSSEVCCVSERGRRLNEKGDKRQDKGGEVRRGYEFVSKEKVNCLTTVQKDNLIYRNGGIHKLTPIEVERLQTVPENYTACLSNAQRYKTLGNGWTVDVIAHILSFMD